MSKKVIFSIFLIITGVILGLLIIFSYEMSGGNPILSYAFLSIAILCIMTGTVLIFSRLLDRTVNPLVEEIHKDIDDDIQDLKRLRFTNTHAMVITISVAVLLFSFFIFRFHKVEAMWGPVPVIIPTFICMIALAWFLPRTSWFRTSRDHTPMGIFLIPTIGFIISLWLGLAKTENMEVLHAQPGQVVGYNSNTTGYVIFETVGSVADNGFSSSLPSCDDDVCGVILLVIGLILLTLVLVIGSAAIPHFWILSGSLLLGIMLLIAIHDLRIRPVASEDSVTAQ